MSSLSSGRSVACTSGFCSGGIADFLYLANSNQVDSVTQSSANKATGITMSPSAAVFYKFDFRDYSAQFNETVTVDDTTKAVSVEQTFEMAWPCRNHDDRNLIMDLACNGCGMVAIHSENTGTFWIWGYNSRQRVFLQTAESQSGALLTDPNQNALTLRALASEMSIEWTPGSSAIPL